MVIIPLVISPLPRGLCPNVVRVHWPCTRHFIINDIGSCNNRDSWDSPLDARIRGLPLVHRHCPTRMGNPCMRGLLLHSPRHQQQLRRGAPRPAEGGAAAVDAGGSAAAARACKNPPFAWGNAGARAGARVNARRPGSPTNLENLESRL